MKDMSLKDLILNGDKFFLPNLSIDCVIFSLEKAELRVLLLKINGKNSWVLPGGYIQKNESINNAALRILKIRTGLQKIFLTQFETFGEAERLFPKEIKMIVESLDLEWNSEIWMNQRFVSIGFYALINYKEYKATGNRLNQELKWQSINNLPDILMDHKNIINKAHSALKFDLNYRPIGYNLLPQKFTMPELQKMYETILEIKLERSHFQKKMLKFGIYERLNKRVGLPHKNPYLYQFDLKKYKDALEKGTKFDL